MELLHCAVLLALIFQAECEVSVSQKSVEVRPGDEARLSCATSSPVAFCAFSSPSGDNYILQTGLVYDGDRISKDGEEEGVCAVKITNIQEKDNGVWKCSLTLNENNKARQVEETVKVVVSRAPSNVHIEIDDAPTSELVVNFREKKDQQIACIADGARPAATFSWMLGQDAHLGRVEDRAAVELEDRRTRQVQVLHYEAEPGHNGQAITCIVHHAGFTTADKEANKNLASLDLDIKFQPVAADQPVAFYNLQVGETKDVLISFRAHPRPTEVFWSLHDESRVGEGSESLSKRYRAEVLKEGPNDGQYTAKLTISAVTEEDAGTTNELSVTNELGTTIYPFTLSLGDKPAAVAGTGPVIAIVARSQGMLCFADPPKPEEDKEKAVEKEEGETESAKGEDAAKDETDEAAIEDGESGEIINNNTSATKAKSVTARVTSLLSAVKKSVGGRKEKYSEAGGEGGELQEGKENGVATEDDLQYADLDKSAMSSAATVAVENEKTVYAEIRPETKE